MHNATTISDELLYLEFLLDLRERTEYMRRLKRMPDRFYEDLYLLFGQSDLPEDFQNAVSQLFDSAWDFREGMVEAVNVMAAASERGIDETVQNELSDAMRDRIGKSKSQMFSKVGPVIKAGIQLTHKTEA